jgi:hypothetical protein
MLKIKHFGVQMRLGDVVFLTCHTLLFYLCLPITSAQLPTTPQFPRSRM